MSLYENFTKRNSVTKSITMELKPTEATRIALSENGVLKFDAELENRASSIKDVIDKMYLSLISDASANIDIDWNDVAHSLHEEDANIKDIAENVKATISAAIVNTFEKKYGKDNYNAAFLFGAFKEWLNTNPKGVDNISAVKETLESLKGCSAIFTTYFTSRKTILEGTKTNSFACRVWDNFLLFLSNVENDRFIHEQTALIDELNKEMDLTAELCFSLDEYNSFLTQDGIDIYNQIICGYTDGKMHIKGLNSLVNEFNQAHKADSQYKVYRKFKTLDKSILSEKTAQYVVTGFNTDKECLETVIGSYESNADMVEKTVSLITSLKDYEPNKIILNSKKLGFISKKLFNNPTYIKNILGRDTSISLEDVNELVKNASEAQYDSVEDMMNEYMLDKYAAYEATVAEYNVSIAETVDNQAEYIRNYFDIILDIVNTLNYFDTDSELVDDEFVNLSESITENRNAFREIYNKTRNFVTKKPKDLSKKSITCLGDVNLYSNGWTLDPKDPDVFKKGYQSFFIKDGKYYYATYSKKAESKLSRLTLDYEPSDDCYTKIVVNALPDAGKNAPRFFISNNEIRNQFADPNCKVALRTTNMTSPMEITRDFYDKYNAGWHKKSYVPKANKVSEKELKKATEEHESFMKEYMTTFLEFFKNFNPTKIYNYDSVDIKNYADTGEFFSHINSLWYKLSKAYIDAESLDTLVESGDIYLFEVSNRFVNNGSFKSVYSKIFRYLFSDENMDNTNIKLNGSPKFFYRPAALDRDIIPVHKAGSILVNRITRDGIRIPEDSYLRIYKVKNHMLNESALYDEDYKYLNDAVCKEAKYDIVKDNRYTKEQYSITFSVNLNNNVWTRPCSTKSIIKSNATKGTKILSVVRGENNLLYYVLLGQDGTILAQHSLNSINGIDYQLKLKSLSIARKNEQKSWKSDIKVADVKEGYLSQALSEIIKIAYKESAMICIEDLDEHFKNRRTLVDNQVYKKFETGITNRLSCYYDKNIEANHPGSFNNPLQLADNAMTNAIQNGILLKIESSYTANICPVTGFASLFAFSNVRNRFDEREFLCKMDKIVYDKNSDVFEFTFDYNNFETTKKVNKTRWTLVTSGTRTRWDAATKRYDEYVPTEDIKDILHKENISYEDGHNLVEDIKTESFKLLAVTKLYNIFRDICNLRVYTSNDSYIVSPVKGITYDSRNVNDNSLPNCPDSAKAYNLGRKALLNMNKLVNEDSIGIKAEEWLNSITK